MRRLTAALALSAAVLVAPASPALAAQGTLTIGWDQYANPQGCYPVQGQADSLLVNDTDSLALVLSGPNCEGQVVHQVPAGGRAVVTAGSSVYIG
ncbi:hypothetical protein [Streptomyces sp. NPDC058374]|uniref:hypothetical protein n=1 Tax=unclassified Streptomyces TaxID=2593676 RepID=UPI00365F598F